jgi:hypothetical protein
MKLRKADIIVIVRSARAVSWLTFPAYEIETWHGASTHGRSKVLVDACLLEHVLSCQVHEFGGSIVGLLDLHDLTAQLFVRVLAKLHRTERVVRRLRGVRHAQTVDGARATGLRAVSPLHAHQLSDGCISPKATRR